MMERLAPLQQPARRCAQEQLCPKLSGLGAKIPGGKWLRIEVGDTPSFGFRSDPLQGQGVKNLSDFQGKPVLVEFWGTR